MSGDPQGPQRPHTSVDGPERPTEEELRAAYEAELSRITSGDMMLQAAVSLLNIGGRRLGLSAPRPADGTGTPDAQGGAERDLAERDLEQVRDAIDAVRALLLILERSLPRELGPLRDALSQLQMAYAREVQHRGGEEDSGPSEAGGSEPQARAGGAGKPSQEQPAEQDGAPTGDEGPKGPGPAESSGRLWVPGR
jgi:hypothetical protein